MRGRLILFNIVVVMFLLAVTPRLSLTQTGDSSCPALVQQALEDLGNNCGDLSRNSACYGFNRVSALFNQDVTDAFFSKPADVSDLKIMQSLETAPLDTLLNQWGVAVLSVQANIPNTLPGQAARFVLLGDVSLKNDVPADEASKATAEPITVTTAFAANIRSAASSRANVIASVPAGTSLKADALSKDRAWLRVTYAEKTVGWMSRQVVQGTEAADGLPLISEEPRTAMQAFHFSTGIGQPICEEAPALLVVQGPDNVKINITANGANIQLGSTIALFTKGGKFKMITVDGKAEADGVVVPAGFGVEVGLDDKGDVDGNFGGFHVLTEDELNFLKILETIPPDVLNYPIKLPDIQKLLSNAPAAGKADCSKFKGTSPVEGFAYGWNVFYWDGAPGATSYRVTVPGVGSAEVSAPETTLSLDLSSAGFNPQMSWYVEALVNNQVACKSQVITIPRETQLSGDGSSGGSLSASWSCVRLGTIVVNYSGVPAGDSTVTINYSGAPHSPPSGYTVSVPPSSGSVTLSATISPGFMAGGSVVANPSGQKVGLPSLRSC
jgi:SH3 domain-containing protein